MIGASQARPTHDVTVRLSGLWSTACQVTAAANVIPVYDGATFEAPVDADYVSLSVPNLQALPGADAYDGRLCLARDFDPAAPKGSDVPDPYYGGEGGFEHVLDLCRAACQGMIDHLRDTGRLD